MSGWWNPGDPAPIVAVAIGAYEDGGTHSGIVYRADETGDDLRFLHLKFHYWLANDRFPAATGLVEGLPYHLLIPHRPIPMLKAVAFQCRRIAREKPQIPLGFAPTRITFDSEGRMRAPIDNRGLNCSTFVLRVFESVGVRLLDESTWQHRPEDEVRFKQLHERLEKHVINRYALHPKQRDHLAHVRKIAPDVKSVRVRPEETAGACLSKALPVKFEEAKKYGYDVLERVRPATAPTPVQLSPPIPPTTDAESAPS
jgi:hypothetical protein